MDGSGTIINDNGMTMFYAGILVGLACIAFGVYLLVAKKESLQSNSLLNGGKHRKGSALIIYRFTGIQMIALGVLLVLCVLSFTAGYIWTGLILFVLIIALPIACSSYAKRSKRFK